MEIEKVHLLFEQSGTFKKAFKDYNIDAFDYDILNDFHETDVKIDLFEEIENSYLRKNSIFDFIKKKDLIFAFFPCVRFENQFNMLVRGDAFQYINDSIEDKLYNSLFLMRENYQFYSLITKLAIICLRDDLRLIIENPYSKEHYLYRYWPVKPAIIDLDRTKNGDYFKKPTQYYFINCCPEDNLVFSPGTYNQLSFDGICGLTKADYKKTCAKNRTVARSLMHSDYVHYFIEKYIL